MPEGRIPAEAGGNPGEAPLRYGKDLRTRDRRVIVEMLGDEDATAGNTFGEATPAPAEVPPDACESEHTDLLVNAVDAEDWEEVTRILTAAAEVNVNARTSWSTSLLRAAAEDGAVDVCRLLLEHRADVNARDSNAMTPLMGAVVGGDRPEVVQVLLEAGADIAARTDDGFTALAWAWRLDNDSSSTKLLLDQDPTADRHPVLRPSI